MNRQWRGFAVTLRIGLIVAAGVAIPATLIVAVQSSSPVAADAVLTRWQEPAAGAPGLRSAATGATVTARVAIVALLAIPIVAYGAIGITFVRRRRVAHATIATLQLLVLLGVAGGWFAR